nr:ribonuclease H-like domain-containing protein [Tanacetum cinerariifolium]
MKGIKRQYSVARTPEQNRVAEMRNRILIEAARTMLADSKLPNIFWVEAVNTACYVQNRVLVVKPHNKTPYEIFHGRTPTLSFIRPFGCPVTILNTLDHLGKFDGKADECFFVGYSLNSKAFRVFNSRKRTVEENLHIRFSESTPNAVGSRPDWVIDIDALIRPINYEPIVADTQYNGFVDPKSSHDDGFKPSSDDGKKVDKDPRKESECKDQEKEDNKFNFSKWNFNSMMRNLDNVFGNFLMYPRVRKWFFGKITPLFPTMVVQSQLEEGSIMPTNPQHTPTILKPSSSQPQKTHKPRKAKRNDTQVPQLSGPTKSVVDEAVYKELDDRLVRAATTAASLEAEQDNGNIDKTQSKATPNESSSQGTNSGGGPRCQEAMGDTITQTRFENVL